MQTEIHSIVELPGYPELYDHCCDLVESAPNRKLAAAALLNAAIAISMATMGARALADGLHRAADNLAAEEVKSRGRLS